MQSEPLTEPSPTVAPPPSSTTDRLLRLVRRILLVIGGFTLILFGLALGFVPGIPGWPLGLLGLSMLAAAEIVWARQLLRRVKAGANRLREVLFPRATKLAEKRKAEAREPGGSDRVER